MQTSEPTATTPPASRPERRRRRASSARVFVWMAGVAALLALLRTAYGEWVEPELRRYVIEEFRKRGFETSIRRISINPFSGVAAHDVRLLDATASGRVIASVNHLALAIDWGALARHQTFIDHLEIRHGTISLPGGAPGREGEYVLRDLQARLQMGPAQIRLSQARWTLGGIRVAARGTILNPQQFRMPPNFPEPASARGVPRGSRAAATPSVLGRLAMKHPGEINIEFHADFAQSETAHLRATARLGQGAFGRYKFRGASAELVVRGPMIELRNLEIQDAEGEAGASGSYDFNTGLLQARVLCGIDIQRLLPELLGKAPASTGAFDPAILDECVFYPMPQFDLRIRAQTQKPASLSVIGSVSTDKVVFKNLTLDKLHGDFSWDGARFYLRNFALEHKSGRLNASVLTQPGQLRASIDSTINPNALKPLFTGRVRAALDEWDFEEPPSIQFQVTGTGPDLTKAAGEGQLHVGRLKYHGVGVNTGSAKLKFANGAFTYEDFWIERPEGFAGGTMVYDFVNKEIRLSDVVTTIDPMETCVWIDPRLLRTLRSFRFRKPPTLSCNGRVQFGGKTDNDFQIVVNAPAGLDYFLLGKWLPIEQASATLKFRKLELTVADINARVYGGKALATTTVSLVPGDPRFSTSLDLENINFEDMTRLYFGFKDSQGLLQATYDFSGRTNSTSSINGRGTLQVVDGDIFAIPYIGPISALLNEIVPGMGYARASKASATFETRNGVINTHDFEVHSASFSMLGGGWLDFNADKMDFNVRVNARGVPGIILFPVSKLFEYTSTSKLSEPRWRAKRFTIQ